MVLGMSLIIVSTGIMQLNGLSQNQAEYLKNCPSQNRSLPCLPGTIDRFISSQIRLGSDLQRTLSKVYIPGVCYSVKHKFCPTLLRRCTHTDNYGHNYTLDGVCTGKRRQCPLLDTVETCEGTYCDPDQYLCHPQGCIPIEAHCNGRCPPLPSSLIQTNHTSNYSTLANNQFKEREEPSLVERIVCGDSCLTRDEAKDFYDCEGVCQLKSEPCDSSGETLCPQHFTLCGTDTCLNRFAELELEAETGYPGHFSCAGVCTLASTPCEENSTLHCQPGYWLCEDQSQCILLQEIGKLGSRLFTQLCDGVAQCQDGSDESYHQCFLAYKFEILLITALVLLVVPLAAFILYCNRSRLLPMLNRRRAIDPAENGKSYRSNEDEMHLRGVAPEDVD